MKKFKIAIIFTLIICMLVPLSACKTEEEQAVKPSYIEDDYTYIWSENSLTKILQTEGPKENDIIKVDMESAKGEKESAQILIRAKDQKIDNYSVTVSDLRDGDKTLSSDCIEIFSQHYVEVKTPTNKVYPKGMYPDAIIPLDKVILKEENFVDANCTQGVWFTLFVPYGQERGNYSGTIHVNLDGTNYSIPLSVVVYDFTVPKENHAPTAFAIWEDRGMMESGYGTDATLTKADKDKYVKAEYESLLEYRVTPTNIPLGEYSSESDFGEAAYRYASREDVACFRIPTSAPNRVLNKSSLSRILKSILSASVKHNFDLFSKAYFYVPEIDEPHPSTGGDNIYNEVNNVDKAILVEKNNLISYVNSTYPNIANKAEIIKSIGDLQHIVTAERRDQLVGKVQTFCPLINNYNNMEYFDETERRKAEYGEGSWWYTCVTPENPYPSYHIDDTLVGARTMGIMQKRYNIQGTLYWATNIYKKYDGKKYLDRDIFNDPHAFPGAAGDGFLTYPGIDYGVEGVIASIRLSAIRDAQEDYEYLYLLQNLLDKANEKYSLSITLDCLLEDVYSRLFKGVVAVDDVTLMKSARKEIASLIEALSSESNALIVLKNYSADNYDYYYEIYANEGSSISVNGKKATYADGKFLVSVKANDRTESKISINYNGETNEYTRGYFGKTVTVDGMNANRFTSDDFSISADSFAFDGDSSLKLVYENNSTNEKIMSLKSSQFGITDFTKVSYVYAYVYNDSDSVIKMSLGIEAENGRKLSSTGHLYPKKWNKITLRIYEAKNLPLDKITSLEIGALNPSVTTTVYVDNIYLEYK